MMEKLNVLYACDNNYAPFACVSICSLLMNNKSFEQIDIYVVLDNVNADNLRKLKMQTEEYGANLIAVDGQRLNREIECLNLPKYRGTHAANYRIFFEKYIGNDVEKLLYLDCDTIVLCDLLALISENMEDYCAFVVKDALSCNYKTQLGFREDEPYFNTGMLLFHVPNWEKNNCTLNIINHLKNVRSNYCNPDQDVLNIVLRNKVKFINPKYNFQPVHRMLKDDKYMRIYSGKGYYSFAQLEEARRNPAIYHAYRFLGEFPWHKNSWHPDTELFDSYLLQSCQKDYVKSEAKKSVFIGIEKILFLFLPKEIFFRIHRMAQDRSFFKQDAELKRKNNRSRK